MPRTVHYLLERGASGDLLLSWVMMDLVDIPDYDWNRPTASPHRPYVSPWNISHLILYTKMLVACCLKTKDEIFETVKEVNNSDVQLLFSLLHDNSACGVTGALRVFVAVSEQSWDDGSVDVDVFKPGHVRKNAKKLKREKARAQNRLEDDIK